MNINSEFYEFKRQNGCTKCKKEILENSLVIAHECNVKYCKYILCPTCHKELISNIVTEKKDEMTNTPTAKKPKRSSRRSRETIN